MRARARLAAAGQVYADVHMHAAPTSDCERIRMRTFAYSVDATIIIPIY